MTVADKNQPPTDVDMKEAEENAAEEEVPKRTTPPGSTVFTWKVDNYSTLVDKTCSETFLVDADKSLKWQLMLFPHGNSQPGQVALYLACTNLDEKPEYYTKRAGLHLLCINQNDPEKSVMMETDHKYKKEHNDWGFPALIEMDKLVEKNNTGFVVNDTVIFEAIVTLRPDIEKISYDYNSKEATGMVGLKNQGATCYMNSLLQTLYHLRSFRRAVYRMPIGGDKSAQVTLSLQKLFYDLQSESSAVGTKELTSAFGWDSSELFTQHDVQELNRILQDNLEEKMKGTVVEGEIPRLFGGKIENFLKCVNVDFESTREEPFYDLSLNVKGCKDVEASFEKYCEVEMMDGANKYMAEGHGLQDAKKGLHFKSFPPVLNLHLRRFEWDFMLETPTTYKINDRYEFPVVLNLNKYMKDDPTGDESKQQQIFHLFSVLVHAGDTHGGHYYTFIRPQVGRSDAEWFKFDDDRVQRVDEYTAVDGNFGGHDDMSFKRYGKVFKKVNHRSANAYMLVYIREDEIARLQERVDVDDIPPALMEKIENDKKAAIEAKKQRELEKHMRMVQVVTLADMKKHRVLDLVDLKTPNVVPTFPAPKTATLDKVADQISELLTLPRDQFRLWRFVGRQNHTQRPEELLSPQDLLKDTVASSMLTNSTLPVHQKVAFFVEETPATTPYPAKGMNLMFYKYFDPYEPSLKPVGYGFHSDDDTLADLQVAMNRCMGWDENEPLQMWEEIKQDMIDVITPNQPMLRLEIGTGDVIIFMKPLQPGKEKVPYSNPKAYCQYLVHRHVIKVRPYGKTYGQNVPNKKTESDSKGEEGEFELEISRADKVSAVAIKIGEKLGKDGERLRLWSHSTYYNSPSGNALDWDRPIRDGLYSYNEPCDIVYYQEMSIPVTEIEKMNQFSITLVSRNLKETKSYDLFLPPEATIGDLGADLKKQAGIEGEVKILLMGRNRVTKVLDDVDVVAASEITHPKYAKLEAYVIPQEEAEMPADCQLVPVVSCTAIETFTQCHSHPFYQVVGPKATVGEVKEILKARLEPSETEYKKWQLHIITTKRETVLDDPDAIFSEVFKSKTTSPPTLGIQRPAASSYSRSGHVGERSIKIHN